MLALGRGDRRLDKTLSLHIPRAIAPSPGGLLGLELEFSVRPQEGAGSISVR
jgi:hypothetical protein